MSEKTPIGGRESIRKPNEAELRLITELLRRCEKAEVRQKSLEGLQVLPLSDGGMGSLYLEWVSERKTRRFSARAAELQFLDSDGVIVIASLNLDKEGELFELDMWKVDYSPLLAIPETDKFENVEYQG